MKEQEAKDTQSELLYVPATSLTYHSLLKRGLIQEVTHHFQQKSTLHSTINALAKTTPSHPTSGSQPGQLPAPSSSTTHGDAWSYHRLHSAYLPTLHLRRHISCSLASLSGTSSSLCLSNQTSSWTTASSTLPISHRRQRISMMG